MQNLAEQGQPLLSVAPLGFSAAGSGLNTVEPVYFSSSCDTLENLPETTISKGVFSLFFNKIRLVVSPFWFSEYLIRIYYKYHIIVCHFYLFSQ